MGAKEGGRRLSAFCSERHTERRRGHHEKDPSNREAEADQVSDTVQAKGADQESLMGSNGTTWAGKREGVNYMFSIKTKWRSYSLHFH